LNFKKEKKKLENCKAVREEGKRLAMRGLTREGLLGGAELNLSS